MHISWMLQRAGATVLLAGLLTGCTDHATVRIDPSRRFQTIVGWEAHHQSGVGLPHFDQFKDTLLWRAVNDLGINRIRIEAWSGFEQRMDWYAELQAGRLPRPRPHRFCTENDNDDPNVIRWEGFHFTLLDEAMEAVVLPLRKLLEARGEKLYLNLTYDSFYKQCPSTPYIHDQPEEYAEFALAMFLHLRDKYGVVPDSWEMILEPDNSAWSGEAIGKTMVVAAERLKQYGFTPDFVAPSTTALMRSVTYFDDVMSVAGARAYLREFSYHRYGGQKSQWPAQLRAIAERGKRYGIRTSMLEHVGSGYEDLHEDLELANVSAWQQFALAYGGKDNGAQQFVIDDSGNIQLGERSRYLRQYFRYVRSGAVRVGATSTSARVAPLAFQGPGQKSVVVVKADRSARIRVLGLPSGNYGTSYTTALQTGAEGPPLAVAEGGALVTTIPGKGVITIYSR